MLPVNPVSVTSKKVSSCQGRNLIEKVVGESSEPQSTTSNRSASNFLTVTFFDTPYISHSQRTVASGARSPLLLVNQNRVVILRSVSAWKTC